MIFISHRGNITGPNKKSENNPEYINRALRFFNVEIDVWFHNGSFYLGHDSPEYNIDISWLKNRQKKLWIHCKNINAMLALCDLNDSKNFCFNFFGHDKDDYVLTSLNYIFTIPKCEKQKWNARSVIVMPEYYSYTGPTSGAAGVLTDFLENNKM